MCRPPRHRCINWRSIRPGWHRPRAEVSIPTTLSFAASVPPLAAISDRLIASGLGDVLMRVPPEAPLSYLTLEQNAELLDWDAEKYRQALDA